MQKRPDGFLSTQNIDQDGDAFDYIRELQQYLWRFVRVELPCSSGDLAKYVDVAIEQAEYKRNKHKPKVG